MRCLEGKVALITGAASGIGEETTRLFVENGAKVVVVDIQDELGLQVVASIGTDKAIFIHCDVTKEDQVEEAVNKTLQTYGNIDILFSNAGIIGTKANILDLDMDKMDETWSTNVRGMAATIKHVGRAMVARKNRGSIICTASVAAIQANMGTLVYTVSKHAVVGLVKAASVELGKYGIRVNCISPFGVATPMACNFFDWEPSQVEDASCSQAHLKGIVFKTHHVAQAALFLASNQSSSFITGHNLVLDGGLTVAGPVFQSS